MSADLIEVLKEIGTENITLQFINQNLTGFEAKEDHVNISFASDKENTPFLVAGTVELPKVGLVLWLDREQYISTVNAISARKLEKETK